MASNSSTGDASETISEVCNGVDIKEEGKMMDMVDKNYIPEIDKRRENDGTGDVSETMCEVFNGVDIKEEARVMDMVDKNYIPESDKMRENVGTGDVSELMSEVFNGVDIKEEGRMMDMVDKNYIPESDKRRLSVDCESMPPNGSASFAEEKCVKNAGMMEEGRRTARDGHQQLQFNGNAEEISQGEKREENYDQIRCDSSQVTVPSAVNTSPTAFIANQTPRCSPASVPFIPPPVSTSTPVPVTSTAVSSSVPVDRSTPVSVASCSVSGSPPIASSASCAVSSSDPIANSTSVSDISDGVPASAPASVSSSGVSGSVQTSGSASVFHTLSPASFACSIGNSNYPVSAYRPTVTLAVGVGRTSTPPSVHFPMRFTGTSPGGQSWFHELPSEFNLVIPSQTLQLLRTVFMNTVCGHYMIYCHHCQCRHPANNHP